MCVYFVWFNNKQWSYYKYGLLTCGKLEDPKHALICFMLTAILVDVNTIISVVEMKT